MAKIFLTKREDGTFIPSYRTDKEKADKIPVGGSIQLNYRPVRNPGHHAKYWALLGVVADRSGEAKETIHSKLKYLLGEYDVIGEIDGRVQIAMRSTDYSTMDKFQWEEYYRKAVAGLVTLYGEWIDSSDIEGGIDEQL